MDTEAKIKPLEELDVVRKFSDVFSKDLTQLPPDRETEFAIDLIPGAAPEADAKTRYLLALDSYEKLWKEKSRNKWLKEGDRNSKFFHLSIVIRRPKNQIRCLKKSDATIVSNPASVPDFVSNCFEDFHKSIPLDEHLEILEVIPNVLGVEDRAILDRVPGLDEVKSAVWDFDPDSLPCPDSFHGAFFRRCWGVVGSDVGRAVVNFFRQGIMLKGINNCFISLIPKMENAISLDRFRPICIGNFFCKIISKVLANRLGGSFLALSLRSKDYWLGSESIVDASGLGAEFFLDKATLVPDFITDGSWSLPQVRSSFLLNVVKVIKDMALSCKGIPLVSHYEFCKADVESDAYIFLECPFALAEVLAPG
ncbi:uncharacterized protein LOC122650742 [Telopea speciosissima]|uniref:uncharacterized protein LOC122650742 n=1 Tax=Telopea speciosissima TaxID=54955 RepID=UPI001CC39B11|nr:uncharacterized protein LOC122650742 [Telopea speciosissima]